MSTPPFKIGQRIVVKLSGGRVEEATIRALVESTEGLRLQVDFGFKDDQTVLVYEWQVVKD